MTRRRRCAISGLVPAAMNASKTPRGQWWLGWVGPESADAGAAGLADDIADVAAGASAAGAAASAREAPIALKENPNVGGLG